MGRKIAWVLSLALGAFLYGVLGLITTRNAQVPGSSA